MEAERLRQRKRKNDTTGGPDGCIASIMNKERSSGLPNTQSEVTKPLAKASVMLNLVAPYPFTPVNVVIAFSSEFIINGLPRNA